MASQTKKHGNGGTGAQAEGAAYVGPYEEATATIKITAANEATDDKNGKDGHSAKGGHGRGHGLRHGMAGLKAAMAVPRSTAVRLAEHAQANQATTEEMATKHKAVCRSIVDDQAGALGAALSPFATKRAYLAILNAEGIFSVMHGLQWWAEAPGGPRNQRGRIVAFEGEVRTGTGLPNLWRFKEPDDHLFRLLTLPQVSLSNTARFYEDKTNDEYYCTTVVPDEEGPGRAPACGQLIPIPVKWVPMFLDYLNAGTAFHRLVDLVNSVDRAERDKFTYLAQSTAYACLSANEDEHHGSTMSIQ